MRPAVPLGTPRESLARSAMHIGVCGRELEAKPELRIYVERRLLSTLGHLTRAIECIVVRAHRVEQGPLRGATRCQVVARLFRGREVVEEDSDVDQYTAIDRVAEALARDVEYLESRLPPGEALRCA